jgi:hypothetical protein
MLWVLGGVLVAIWVLESITSRSGKIHSNSRRGRVPHPNHPV